MSPPPPDPTTFPSVTAPPAPPRPAFLLPAPCRWERQATTRVEEHARVVDALNSTHRAGLAAGRGRYGALSTEKDLAGREAAEVRRQMEEDVDREVEELNER